MNEKIKAGAEQIVQGVKEEIAEAKVKLDANGDSKVAISEAFDVASKEIKGAIDNLTSLIKSGELTSKAKDELAEIRAKLEEAKKEAEAAKEAVADAVEKEE